MSDKKKISVVLLGNGDSLKKALITIITGKDLSQLTKTSVLKKTDIYENDIYKFICTPDLHTECDDVKGLLATTQHLDMSLLLVEDGLSSEKVWQQVGQLHKKTGKPTEEFRVVLPLSCVQSDSYPFKSNTVEQVFTELRKLAEERRLTSTSKRHAAHAEPNMSTSHTPMEVTEMYAETTVNLILLGMSGTGKSASGNTILGRNHFTSTASSKPVTTECQEAETVIHGKRVRVIDTPDILDNDIKSSVKNKHVEKCKQLCQSGPCVFILVMHVSRFTDGERDVMKKMEKTFGLRVQEETVILFTRGDDLKRAGMSLEDFLSSCQPDLKKIVEKCGNRCVVFENRTSDSHQARELMQKVERVLKKQQELCMDRT